jgi:hypothetical protein
MYDYRRQTHTRQSAGPEYFNLEVFVFAPLSVTGLDKQSAQAQIPAHAALDGQSVLVQQQLKF